ncbi:MAG: flagellar M-ring protein FliF [Clostridiales Family XIII bacterium]|jgi:flagellar M-ring protein FliF|nr:flagellar M-ring protein FliF [Clostridiales Family XIII bacterium]
MGEQLTKILAPLQQFWGKLGKGAKRALIAAFAALILAALVFSIFINTEKYTVLFDDLPQTESSEILSQLYSLGFKPKADSTGRILVPEKEESNARMQLATAGYPKNGLSYYLIEENNSMLTTDYARKQAQNAQIQERIAAAIKTLEGVRDAVVTITMPNENVFYLQPDNPPSASVVLHMKQGSVLTAKQITGIQTLVAKSVNGLSADNIALIDGQGNYLSNTSDGADGMMLEATRQFENDVKQKVISVLTGPYRPGQVKVEVSAILNTDRSVSEESVYYPWTDDDNRGIISYESTAQESYQSTSGDAGVPGTDTNSETPTYPTGGTGGESQSSSSGGETNYEVSSLKTQTLKNSARPEIVTIGIAIDKDSFIPGEEAKIVNLAAAAAGVSPENISVQNFPFYQYETEPEPELPEQGLNRFMIMGIIAGAVLLLALIALLLLLRRKKKKEAEAAAIAAAEEAAALAAAEREAQVDENGFPKQDEDEEIGRIEPMKDRRREEIQQFAKNNPEITAQMIKSLLKAEME